MNTKPSDSLTKQTINGFKWSSLSTIVQGILQLAIFTTLAHLLGPREFGMVGMATIFTNFIERVGFLGVGQSIVQREKLTEAHIRCGFVLCLSLGLLLFALFYVAAPWIAHYFEEDDLGNVLRVIAFSFVFASAAEVSLSLMQREMRFKQLLFVTNIPYLIGNGVVGITLAVLGYSYWALVFAILVARVIRLVLALRAAPQRFSLNFSRSDASDLLRVGLGFSLGRMTNYCALVGDNFVVGKILGAQSLGLYSRAYQLMTAPSTYFGQILERVFFAALSQRQNEREKIAKYFLYGIELCSLVSISGAVILTVAAPEVVTMLFGKQWLGAVPTIQILAFGVYFRTCYKNSDTVVRAVGAVYRLAWQQTVYAGLVIAGSVIGSRWGIEGVSIAVLVALIVNYCSVSRLCMQELSLGWREMTRAHAPTMWIAFWQFAVLAPTTYVLRAQGIPTFAFLLCVGLLDAAVTGAALVFCPRVCSPRVFLWMARNVELERFGKAGRLGKQVLLRAA